jgi:hypothetical protein
LREEPRALFEVEFLAVPEAKGKEMVVRGLPVEVEHNLAGVPAQGGVVADGMWPEPLGGRGTAGKKLVPHRAVNERVLVCQQTEQGDSLALRDFLSYRASANRIHTLMLHVS